MGYLTQVILEEKEVWDIVNGIRPELTTIPQIRKKDKNNTIVSKTIKQGVNSDLYTNNIGERNLYRSCKILQ